MSVCLPIPRRAGSQVNIWVQLYTPSLPTILQYFRHLMPRVDSLEKTDAGRDWGQEEKGTTEDEMAGWHHRLDELESEWTLAVGDGQGGLACCDSWGRKESDTTERLYWTELPLFYVSSLYDTQYIRRPQILKSSGHWYTFSRNKNYFTREYVL